MTLCYSRNKHASVLDLEDGSLLARAIVEDTFFAGSVEMKVKVPDLEIVSVQGQLVRAFNDECPQVVRLLQEIVGLRIGSGINKAVSDFIGGSQGCPRLADLVLECIDQVILRFTLPTIRETQTVKDQDRLKATKEMLRKNPTLLGSCIAFAPGSSLLEGIELEK